MSVSVVGEVNHIDLCPRLLFVSQTRAPVSEGPCTGARDAVKVPPFPC